MGNYQELKQRPAGNFAFADCVVAGFGIINPEEGFGVGHTFRCGCYRNTFVVDVGHARWARIAFAHNKFTQSR